MTKDPNFLRAKGTHDIGVRAGFAFPVLAGSDVVAVLEFFSDRPVKPADRLLEIIAVVGTQLGRVVERKRAERVHAALEQRYRLLAENAVDVIWTADMNLRLTYVSPSVTRLRGYSVEEAMAQTLEERLTPASLETAMRTIGEVMPAIARISQPGRPPSLTLELEMRCKDGSTVWTESKMTLIFDEAGRPVEILGVTRNTTERKKLEERLRQVQKMEAIGRLAGGIAHDFNNLATVLKGRSQLLLRRLRPADPLRRDVQLMDETADRAAALTQQLLAFSRKQVLQPKVLDLNAVVANMDTLLRRLIGEDIDLVTVPGPGLGRVKADPSQLEQVIVNLAVNARDATPRGGRLTIETANVELDETYARRHVGVVPGPYVMLAVSDTGIGMDAETQSRIFEPFFTTKELGEGTGLGLATVYGIVNQSGGSIWVYSEPGQGATFKIYLPRVEEAADSIGSDKAQNAVPRGAETILIVEDNAAVRDVARDILRDHGYTVLEARHGDDALRICERHAGPIHLMVTDTVMPQMSGRELAERLTVVRPETKVLYVSGYTDNAIVHNGMLNAGVAFLQKPFTPDALARKVREVLDAARKR
ncbi:MAG: response regulator [Candidatus Rokubacteria bacterium]|nr:response regulator [Candidatus Rokubacteria bacterium]